MTPFTYAYYREALQTALAAGYRFATFAQARALAAVDESICLLRHDCDNDLGKAVAMARIEAELHVQSTYFIMLRSSMYNPLSKFDAEHVREVLALGHTLGLHFDEELVAGIPSDQLAAEVQVECDLLLHYFGQPIDVVSFHRPGPRVLENRVTIDQINTYSKRDLEGYQYVSDSSYISRMELPKAFAAHHFKKLHLNLHPEWWDERYSEVGGRWEAMLLGGLMQRQNELWQREDAFLQKFTCRLEPEGPRRSLPERRIYSIFEIDEEAP